MNKIKKWAKTYIAELTGVILILYEMYHIK